MGVRAMADAATVRALAMKMANYRFAQGQARERGDNDKADEYADEADKAWRELCRATEPAAHPAGGAAAPAVPPGWKLVPVHPTTEMKAAGASINGMGFDLAHYCWSAMLAASPVSTQETTLQSGEKA